MMDLLGLLGLLGLLLGLATVVAFLRGAMARWIRM